MIELKSLRAGQIIRFSGTVYTARDAAHKRIVEALAAEAPLPFPIQGSVIYYAGPTPTKPGEIIGSCGPTSSTRMDDYTPTLLERGLAAMIGKGKRSLAVVESIRQNGAVYFCGVGGAAALFKKYITACELIAYEDLGCEAVRKLEIKDLPLLVGIDSLGNSVLR